MTRSNTKNPRNMRAEQPTVAHHSAFIFPIAGLILAASLLLATGASITKMQFMITAAVWAAALLGLKAYRKQLHIHAALDTIALLVLVEIAAYLAL